MRGGIMQQIESAGRRTTQRVNQIQRAWRRYREGGGRGEEGERRRQGHGQAGTDGVRCLGWRGRNAREKEGAGRGRLQPTVRTRRMVGASQEQGGWTLARMLIMYKHSEERKRRWQKDTAGADGEAGGAAQTRAAGDDHEEREEQVRRHAGQRERAETEGATPRKEGEGSAASRGCMDAGREEGAPTERRSKRTREAEEERRGQETATEGRQEGAGREGGKEAQSRRKVTLAPEQFTGRHRDGSDGDDAGSGSEEDGARRARRRTSDGERAAKAGLHATGDRESQRVRACTGEEGATNSSKCVAGGKRVVRDEGDTREEDGQETGSGGSEPTGSDGEAGREEAQGRKKVALAPEQFMERRRSGNDGDDESSSGEEDGARSAHRRTSEGERVAGTGLHTTGEGKSQRVRACTGEEGATRSSKHMAGGGRAVRGEGGAREEDEQETGSDGSEPTGSDGEVAPPFMRRNSREEKGTHIQTNGPDAVNARKEHEEERRRRRGLRELQRRFREADAPRRAARWRRYPALRRMEEWMVAQREAGERLRRTNGASSQNKGRYTKRMRERVSKIEEQREADRLPWPHTWKKRKRDEASAESAGAARDGTIGYGAGTSGRSTARAHVRRSSARPADFDYDQNPPKRPRGGGRRGTKRKIEYIEDAETRRGELRHTIRIGQRGIQEIEARHVE